MNAVEQLEAIRHLDFSPSLPCEIRWNQAPVSCGRAADGVVRCRSCKGAALSSLVCWGRTLVAAASLGMVQCRWCSVRGKSIGELFEFIPIGGAL